MPSHLPILRILGKLKSLIFHKVKIAEAKEDVQRKSASLLEPLRLYRRTAIAFANIVQRCCIEPR